MAENESILGKTPPTADRRIAYGSDANQFFDLRMPKSKGHAPLAVFIHGGFWRAKYDLSHAGHICAGLAQAGFVAANLEYRRVGNQGGAWPGTFEDITNALGLLLAEAARLQADAKRCVVLGHSAGGQLAVALAARNPHIRGVVALAGVLDLRKAYELHLSNDAVVEFLRGTPAQIPDHYAEASPLETPVKKVRQVLVHGTDDETVPVAFSRDYAKKKIVLHEDVKLVELPKVGHFELIDPGSAAGKRVIQEAKALV
jgi:acetyl esterase/lipase